jgi:hypothetical protein
MTVTAIDLAADRVDANGAMWRLRTLVAMGHDPARIARALGTDRHWVRRVIEGSTKTIPAARHRDVHALWCEWWDRVPPRRDRWEKANFTNARKMASRKKWPTPLFLDEDKLDEPGYRPYGTWRPANGLGIAADDPLGLYKVAS